MRAAVYYNKDQSLSMEEIAVPEIGPNDLLLKVSYCGICGSDIHVANEQLVPKGTVFGHEFSGVIEKIGDNAGGVWSAGDKVVSLGGIPCGECSSCQQGRYATCHNIGMIGYSNILLGAYSEYVRVSAAMTVKVPDAVDMSDAAVVEPLAVSLNAWRKVAPQAGADVLILGGGPIGLAMAKWAKLFGAGTVVVSEMVPARIERAREAGADLVLNAREESDPVVAMQRETGGTPQVIFECVGRPLVQQLFNMAPYGAHLCILGACMEDETIRIQTAAVKDLSLTIPIGYGLKEFEFILSMLAQGKLTTDPLISDVVPLEQAPVLFEALRNPNDHCKVILSNEVA